MKTEIFSNINSAENVFSEYGLSCELWKPRLMYNRDRHNEIEINFLPEGNLTYLFHDRKITIPSNRLIVFWGLIPHQIVGFENNSQYYVCTIPFSLFLSWKLPAQFVEMIVKGNILMENDNSYSMYDKFIIRKWIDECGTDFMNNIIKLEMQARLSRMAMNVDKADSFIGIRNNDTSVVEKIAVYIAQNYQNPIKVSDISKSVGLHPDYANSIFKKTFGRSIYEYLIDERITHAQRLLLTTDMNITEICYDCGFNSISCFNSAFQKITKCSPRDYKRRSR